MSDKAFSNIQGQVDQQVLEQGAFSPMDFLLATGRLLYNDYERWRQGELENLEAVLLGNPQRIRAQVGQAVDYARGLGLVTEEQQWLRWGAAGAPLCNGGEALRISADDTFHQLFCLRMVVPAEAPQMDMFFHSPALVLANSVVAALAGRDTEGARAKLDQLYRVAPNHADLATFDRLLNAQCSAGQPVEDLAGDIADLQALVPVARQLLGPNARDYLVPLWRRLLAPLRDRAFDAREPRLHASYVLAQAQDWPEVSAAISREPAWWQHPELCRRLVQSSVRLADRIESLTGWCYLCWLHPDSAHESLTKGDLKDPGTQAQWQRFLEFEDTLPEEEALSVADFPAWLLLNEPGLAHTLPDALEDDIRNAQQAFCLARDLSLTGSTAGDEEHLNIRRALSDLHPALFHYFKSRL